MAICKNESTRTMVKRIPFLEPKTSSYNPLAWPLLNHDLSKKVDRRLATSRGVSHSSSSGPRRECSTPSRKAINVGAPTSFKLGSFRSGWLDDFHVSRSPSAHLSRGIEWACAYSAISGVDSLLQVDHLLKNVCVSRNLQVIDSLGENVFFMYITCSLDTTSSRLSRYLRRSTTRKPCGCS